MGVNGFKSDAGPIESMSEATATSTSGATQTEGDPCLLEHDVNVVDDGIRTAVERYAVLSGTRGPVTAQGRVEETVDGCRIEMAYFAGSCDRGDLAPGMASNVEVWESESLLDDVSEETVLQLFESEIRPPAEYNRAVSGTWIGRRDAERLKLRLEMSGMDNAAAAAFALASHGVEDYRIERVIEGESADAALRRGKRQLREAVRLLGVVAASEEASVPVEGGWNTE